MQIETYYRGVSTLEDFAVANGLVMQIHERGSDFPAEQRYYASFKGVEIKNGVFLAGCYGEGRTPGLAMGDYANRIQGKTLAVNAMTSQRREILVPNDLRLKHEQAS